MTQHATEVSETKSPLDAAQKIVDVLQNMTMENQSLALQFAMQTLRLAAPTVSPLPASAQTSSHLTLGTTTPNTGNPPDIKSFVEAKAPKSDQQFAAVVAYHYQFEAPESQRKDYIDAKAMKEAARLVKWSQKKDWNMTLNNATRSGFLNRAERGAFSLSSVGENLVAITLPENESSTGNNSGRPGRKSTKKKAKSKKRAKKGN